MYSPVEIGKRGEHLLNKLEDPVTQVVYSSVSNSAAAMNISAVSLVPHGKDLSGLFLGAERLGQRCECFQCH